MEARGGRWSSHPQTDTPHFHRGLWPLQDSRGSLWILGCLLGALGYSREPLPFHSRHRDHPHYEGVGSTWIFNSEWEVDLWWLVITTETKVCEDIVRSINGLLRSRKDRLSLAWHTTVAPPS